MCIALEFVSYLFDALFLEVLLCAELFIFGAFCMFVCLYVGIHHFRLGNHRGICLDTMGGVSLLKFLIISCRRAKKLSFVSSDLSREFLHQ